MKAEEIKEAVKSRYATVALRGMPCCGPGSSCGGTDGTAESISRKVGYGERELHAVPEGANLGLGCGNPVALAALKEGDVVLDLGSGAGFDCFIAASRIGNTGKVIGVDMTPEMVEKAKANAVKGDFQNVEFRLGEIENLPVPDSYVDVIISNCVINLSPDKALVFKEAFRVLKPGGRLMVSDLVLLKELPETLGQSVEAYVGCIAGAIMKEKYLTAMESAGFQQIELLGEDTYPIEPALNAPLFRECSSGSDFVADRVKIIAEAIASIKVSAVKPA